MKDIGWAVIVTILILFISFTVITPIILLIGYSSVEGSYHAITHSILISLIFTVIICTMFILEEIKKLGEK